MKGKIMAVTLVVMLGVGITSQLLQPKQNDFAVKKVENTVNMRGNSDGPNPWG
ncbi:MAG: hypothetical protein RR712_03460 [Terrisporobacter sp.]